ncbi:MAG: ferrous iron transporter B, partial [Chloroflexi bacterium]
TGYTFMVFYMLYLPCLVTTWATWKETRSLKWTVLGIVVPFLAAAALTTVIYRLGLALGLAA